MKLITIDLLQKVCETKTKPTIMECIRASENVAMPSIGICPISAECYSTLACIFEPLIDEFHCVAIDVKQPHCSWGDWREFEKIDSDSIASIRFTCRRSIVGIPFVIGMDENQFVETLLQSQNAIQKAFADEIEANDGAFYKMFDVKENETIFVELTSNRIGFESMDTAKHRFWPTGRGLYVNGARTMSILINEKDHLCFVSTQSNGDFGEYKRNQRKLLTPIRKHSLQVLRMRISFQVSES